MRPMWGYGLVVMLLASATGTSAAASLADIRLWASPDSTRVVLDLSEPASYTLFSLSQPERVVIDLECIGGDPSALEPPPGTGYVKAVRLGARGKSGLRVVLDVSEKVEAKAFLSPPNETYGHRLVIDLGHGLAEADVAQPAQPPVKVAVGDGQRDLVIAIDAGHGGEDPGAIGKGGTREKTVALAIAKKLADRIHGEPGMQAVLTRTGDYFVKLKDRIARARTHEADLFVSVHADAFMARSIRGSSVYVLSTRRASSEAARWLADRENAADLIGGVSLHDKSDVLQSVLLDLSQNAAISASREAAGRVLAELVLHGHLYSMATRQEVLGVIRRTKRDVNKEMYAYAESLDAGGMGIGIYPRSGFIHVDFRAPGEPSYRRTDYSPPGSSAYPRSTWSPSSTPPTGDAAWPASSRRSGAAGPGISRQDRNVDCQLPAARRRDAPVLRAPHAVRAGQALAPVTKHRRDP